jgi:hypothetical protein
MLLTQTDNLCKFKLYEMDPGGSLNTGHGRCYYNQKRSSAMESRTGRVFLVLSCMMFMAGGCAKHEMVKTDQGVAPAASASVKGAGKD